MIVGACSKCGATLYHDSRFVRDELHAYCADHAPGRPETPIEEVAPKPMPFTPHPADAVGFEPNPAVREEAIRKFLQNDERILVFEPTENEWPIYFDPKMHGDGADGAIVRIMGIGTHATCSRCKLRVPMDGADFCETCCRESDFSNEAVAAHAAVFARKARNRFNCPGCMKPSGADGRGVFAAGPFRYHIPCAYRISKEAHAASFLPNPKRVMPDGSPIFSSKNTLEPQPSFTSKGIDANLAANLAANLGFVAPLTQEAIERAFAGRLPVILYEPRSSAAERLARQVIALDDAVEGFMRDKFREALAPMVAEARRVLGE